jgi:hypothetical protein
MNTRASFWALVVGVVVAVGEAFLQPLTAAWATAVLTLTAVLGLIVGVFAPAPGWQAVAYLATANTLMLLAVVANLAVRTPFVQNLLIGLLALLAPYAAVHLFRVTVEASKPAT